MWNLLLNGVKFTPKGGRLTITLTSLAGDTVEVRVEDTGIGISPEFLPNVFEPFRQADASASRRHGGLGLGLAIARHIVELHGGSIRAESAGLGQGAAFIATFPALSALTSGSGLEALAARAQCQTADS